MPQREVGGDQRPPVPVLPSRIRPPEVPDRCATPQAVLAAVRDALTHRVVSVTAPAGMGKTTALSAATAGMGGLAWLTATAALEHPADLLRHLQAAIDPSAAGTWLRADDVLAFCEAGTSRAVVVVDDVHTLAGSAAEGVLRDIGAGLPEHWTLVLCGRLPCAVDRPRWLLAARLAELSTGDLQEPGGDGWPAVDRLAQLDRALVEDYLGDQVMALLPPQLAAAVAENAARPGRVLPPDHAALRPFGLLTRDGRVLPALADYARAHEQPVLGAPSPGPPVRLSCFGGLRAEVAGSQLDLHALKPRPRQLLRLLALSTARPRNREELVELLWPDSDLDSGVRSLQVAVSSLRRWLQAAAGPHMQPILRDGPSYRLSPECVAVDVVEFEASCAAAGRARTSGSPQTAAAHAQQAIDMYRDECLPEAGPAEWVASERDRLRQLAVRATELVAEVRLGAGDLEAAGRACERGIGIDRFDDRLWRTLIAVYRRSGDRAALHRAVERYEDAIAALDAPAMSAAG